MIIYTELTRKAMKIAFDAHKDQTDKEGIPYIYHPVYLATQMHDEASICVALLHDVVEDSDMTFDDLRAEGFTDEIIDALVLLTHSPDVPYMDYVANIKQNPLARKIKLADLRHNSDPSRKPANDPYADERHKKYKAAIKLLSE